MENDAEGFLRSLQSLLVQEHHRAERKLQQDLGALYHKLEADSVYRGSNNVLQTKKVYEQDIEERTAILLAVMERLLAGIRPKQRREFGPLAKKEAIGWLVGHIDAVQVRLHEHAKRLRFTQKDSLDLGRQRVLSALDVELDLLLGHPTTAPSTAEWFVDPNRLDSLSALTPPGFDLSRLVRLCEELNTCFQHGCFHAVAMLTRAVLDHIPPLFGHPTFKEVAGHYPGGRSFKGIANGLDQSARKVTDWLLHTPVRSTESLPTLAQIDVRNQLDAVLAEAIRRFSGSGGSVPT